MMAFFFARNTNRHVSITNGFIMNTPNTARITTPHIIPPAHSQHDETVNPLRSLIDTPQKKYEAQKRRHLPSDTARFLKLAQSNVAKALASSIDPRQMQSAVTMMDCGRYIRMIDDDRYRVINRCHLRSCSICSQIKGAKYTSILIDAMRQLRFTFRDDGFDTHRQMIGLKITLNTGTACHLDDLRERLTILHKLWGRMTRAKYLQEGLIGAIRSTEIIPERDTANTANPHIHGLLLLPADTNVPLLREQLGIYWRRAMRKAISKIDRSLAKPHQVSASFQELKELDFHTSEDAESWLRYATKGGYNFSNPQSQSLHDSASKQYFRAVDTAIKGMRLISTSGDLKDAVTIAKENRVSRKPSEQIDHDSHISTHAWSDKNAAYVEIDSYDPVIHDDRWYLTQSTSYNDSAPLLGALFRYEEDSFNKRATMTALRKMRDRLINNQDHSSLSEIRALFTNDIKRSSDYHEPTEVHRSSLNVITQRPTDQ